jgi:hypothetical protein
MIGFFLDRIDSLRTRFVRSSLPPPPALSSEGGEPYVPFRSARAYLERETKDGKRMLVDQGAMLGIRWHHGPLWFEVFFGDTEPRIEPGPARMVIWQPTFAREKPKGWLHSWIQMNPRCTGYVEVGSKDAYWKSWSDHARRHRNRWLKEDRFQIEDVSLEDFIQAYRRGSALGWLKHFFISHLRTRNALHPSLMRIFGARDKKSGEILAGFVALDLPEVSSSLHLVSFVDRRAMDSSVGTGLIDHWFQEAIARGTRFLDFDLFWAPGDPREWKGFSRFKSQFGTKFIYYPRPFIRFVRGSK